MAFVEDSLYGTWGQLIFTHDSKPPVLISKDLVRLGRKKDCDIRFVGCQFVSGHHCNLSRDPDGNVWIEDVSTNGSLLNGKKINKNEKILIRHNDQVQIVHTKDYPRSDIAFVFQDLPSLREEAAIPDNNADSNSSTHEYDMETVEDISEHEGIKSRSKRPHSETGDTDESPDAKKRREEGQTGTEKKPELLAHNNMADALLCVICQDIFHDCVSLQPCAHSVCAACYSQWMEQSSTCPTCRKKVQRVSKHHMVNAIVESFFKEHPERRRPQEDLQEMDSKNTITEDTVAVSRPCIFL